MKKLICITLGLAYGLLMVGVASAQTSYPMLMSLKPVAAQTGQTSQHTIKSRYSMFGAYRVIVTGHGVTGEIVHPEVKPTEPKAGETVKTPNLTQMNVRFTVAADALPGVRDFRIATPQGVSTLGQLVIVRDAVVSEKATNNTLQQAELIPLPATVCGAIERAEDVDYYKFKVAAGATLNFHVRSMRLQNRIHDLQQHSDPIITLKNAMGSTLAAADNYFYGDPFLSHTFEEEGEYFLEIRDVRFQGNQYWEYSIEINDAPFVSNVFPLGVAPGQTVQLQLIGHNLPDPPIATLQTPPDMKPGMRWFCMPLASGLSNPVPLVVSDLPQVIEAAGDNNELANGQPLNVPAGVSGRIESENDLDYYTFEAKKGDRLTFEVIARRQQSALDSHLRILNVADGKQLLLNDDMRIDKRNYADSLLENWAAPANGKFALEIRDVHLRGGPSYVYFLKVTRPLPHFLLFIDTDKTQLTPGGCGVIFVRVVRKNGFTGPVNLSVSGLPPRVVGSCGKILSAEVKGVDGCVILKAASDAKPSFANISITGAAEHTLPDGSIMNLTAVASPYQETYMPGGGRGHYPVQMHTVSVAAPIDIISVELSQYDVHLKPGESKTIGVTVHRTPEYKKNITLDVLYRHLSGVYGNALPQGVTLDTRNSKTLLTGELIEGQITLTAASNAPPVQNQQISVMANVSLNFVMKATHSSKPLLISVDPPTPQVAATAKK